MRSLVTILLFLLFIPFCIIGQDIDLLEKKAEVTTDWEEKTDIYLSILDTLAWVGEDYEKVELYVTKIKELCETKDCGEKGLIAYAHLSEIEINFGNYQTVEDILLPALNDNKALSQSTTALIKQFVGYYYLINGNSNKAIIYYSDAQKILEENFPTDKRLGIIYHDLGFAYNIDSANEKSIEFLRKSIAHFTSIDDSSKLVECKSGLSTLLTTDGKYNEAIDLILECIEITESNTDSEFPDFNLYEALMDLYIRNGNYEKAEKTYHDVMPQLYAYNTPIEEKAINLWSFHMAYSKLLGRINQSAKGLQHVDSAYVYSNLINEFTVRVTDLRKAGLLVKDENYEMAETHMLSLIEDLKQFGNVDAINAVMVGLFSTIYSKASFKPNQSIQGELLPIVDRIISKNKGQYNSDILDAEMLSVVLGIYSGDKKRSLQSFSMVAEIRDSLHGIEQTKSMNELMVQYETKEAEKNYQIQSLELNKKTSERNTLIGFFLATLFVLGLLFLFFIQKKKYANHLEDEVNKRTAELKKANQELSQNKEELERYNYIASHDLKEPLRNVVSFVDVIKRKELVKDKETLAYFTYIEKGATQMNKIVQDLIDFSKLQNIEVQLQNIDPDNIIEQIKSDLNIELNTPSTTIQTKNLPQNIVFDPTIFKLVFKNLIENGLKFNENNFPFVKIEYLHKEGKHLFEISDNGIGISSEYHQQIFELFKRLNDRSKYSGSGVGLAICKKLLHGLQGNIDVKTNLYGGTTFIIQIPQFDKIVQTSQSQTHSVLAVT